MNKFLYEFVVDKAVEKEVTVEKKPEDDPTITVTRKENVLEPVKFAILKPSRRLYDLAEIFLAKTISDYIREGIMPITLLAKRYGNDAGVLTAKEQAYIDELKVRVDTNQKKLIDLKLDSKGDSIEPPELRSEILIELMETQTEIDNIRNSYMSLYENTAEMKARKKTIEWWITQLSYERKVEKLEEYFPQPSFFDRYKAYVDILDGDSDFDKRVANKFTFLISTWFNNNQNLIELSDFQAADEHFEKNFMNE